MWQWQYHCTGYLTIINHEISTYYNQCLPDSYRGWMVTLATSYSLLGKNSASELTSHSPSLTLDNNFNQISRNDGSLVHTWVDHCHICQYSEQQSQYCESLSENLRRYKDCQTLLSWEWQRAMDTRLQNIVVLLETVFNCLSISDQIEWDHQDCPDDPCCWFSPECPAVFVHTCHVYWTRVRQLWWVVLSVWCCYQHQW